MVYNFFAMLHEIEVGNEAMSNDTIGLSPSSFTVHRLTNNVLDNFVVVRVSFDSEESSVDISFANH